MQTPIELGIAISETEMAYRLELQNARNKDILSLKAGRNVADITDDARAKAMPFWDRTVARINLIRNILPIPPGASKKKISPTPLLIVCIILINEADLKLQNTIEVLATVHPQVWLASRSARI
ncbi:unnamed protein product [Onchocerca ochengi]|uniref:Phage protein n=1 Tax=Onchocerca ochengi TaxID=42157 RepID=A0A182EBF8_ONCOC|nr:unnamed protein product [Onchocerca ochengi]